MKTFSKIALIATGVLLAASVTAQRAQSPEQAAYSAVEVRQSVFKLIQNQNGPIGSMARGRAPMDLAVAERQATRVATLASMIPDVFALDTREFDLETEALDVIWEKQADFAAKAQATVDAANAIAMAAASGDEDATKKAMGAIGRTCGGCHDNFRVE